MKGDFKTSFFKWKDHNIWFVLASFIPGSGILMIYNLISVGRKDLLVLFFEPAIATAFAITFFAPIWTRLKMNHEGELILNRFNGNGAKILYYFRNVFLSLVVIPLLIAIQLSSIASISIPYITSFTIFNSLIICIIFFIAVGYCYRRMIKLEMLIAIFTIILAILHLFTVDSKSKLDNHLVNLESVHWDLILPPMLFFWWFAGLVDMPDMRAQKLLHVSNQKAISWKIAIPYMIIFFIQSIFLWRPLVINQRLFYAIILVLLCNILVLILSWLHWAAKLLLQLELYKKDGILFSESIIERLIMILVILIAIIWVYAGENLQNLFSSILLITSGVGPVYLLRWIWSKINAWTQLSAMLGAIVFPFLTIRMFPFYNYYSQLAISGMFNCLIWLIIMNVTYGNEDEKKAQCFINKYDTLAEFKNGKSWLQFICLTIIFFIVLFSIKIT